MSLIGHWSAIHVISKQDWVLRDEAEAEVERLRAEWRKADESWEAQHRGAVAEGERMKHVANEAFRSLAAGRSDEALEYLRTIPPPLRNKVVNY